MYGEMVIHCDTDMKDMNTWSYIIMDILITTNKEILVMHCYRCTMFIPPQLS
jgi:hypothetical protein